MTKSDRGIRILPLSETIATHLGEGHPHSQPGAYDFIRAGLDTFGPLGYSLLRSEAFTLAANRNGHAYRLAERFRKFAEYREQVSLVDKVQAERLHVQRTRLMFWDLIGGLAESCEQLAAVFTAVRAYDRGNDIGEALLGWNGDVLKTINNRTFQDVAWWEEHLGIPARKDPWWAATWADPTRRPVIATMVGARKRLPVALRAVVDGYSFPVHRVAMKRKHASPLLDGHLAIAPATGNLRDDEWLARQIEDGALVVADDRAGATTAQQVVILVSQAVGDSLFEAWRQANWISLQLAGATIARAENPSSRPLPVDPMAPVLGTLPQLNEAARLFVGAGSDQWEEEQRIQRRTARIRSLAESVPVRLYVTGRRSARRLRHRLGRLLSLQRWVD
ncbi:MAG TPA: hypothetical protein VKR30_04755 [Candidatus Limnocylindrales bacterium]|nr:hypothetical protein [Candidatus Limnocylindrales bacterium]